MLANKLVCILLTQEFLGCSWQIEQGGIHSRFSNRWVHEVYGRRKSNTAILDAIITDKQANIARFQCACIFFYMGMGEIYRREEGNLNNFILIKNQLRLREILVTFVNLKLKLPVPKVTASSRRLSSNRVASKCYLLITHITLLLLIPTI